MQPPVQYITQNPKDELWGMTICSIGYQDIRPGVEYPPKTLHPSEYVFIPKKGRIINEYQLIYIVEGEGTLTTTTAGRMNLKGGDAFLLFPGEWHTYEPDIDKGWKEYWIGFRGGDIDGKTRVGFFTKETPIYKIGYNETVCSLYAQALHVAKKQDKHFQLLLAGIVNYLLGLIITTDSNKRLKDSSAQDLVDKARVFMQNNVESNLEMPEVAEYLNVSYSNFRHIFKQYTGISPSQYYLNIKIQRAKDLLKSTSVSIKEISYILHFETSEYFTKLFKKKTGFTPSAFRDL